MYKLRENPHCFFFSKVTSSCFITSLITKSFLLEKKRETRCSRKLYSKSNNLIITRQINQSCHLSTCFSRKVITFSTYPLKHLCFSLSSLSKTMKEYWTSLASLLGVIAFCQTLMNSVFPPELRFAITKHFNTLFQLFSSYCYFDITEIDGVNTNELYDAVQLYLTSSTVTSNRLSLTRATNSSSTTFSLSSNDSIADTFDSATVLWEHVVAQRQTQTFAWRPMPDEKRGFTLRVEKKDKSFILGSYLDHIMETANEIRRKNQDRFLYTNSRGGGGMDSRGLPWESVPFKHPSTFETLAMDPAKKREIMEDLKDFAECESFYRKTGRAWKRGYLLYGPPGTGKSSMIAAMANYLGYDIYDLELAEVRSNSELRKLLMKTSSKSIIVIEDIDCSIDLKNRSKKKQSYYEPEMMLTGSGLGGDEGNGNTITLSGLLNFTDGLWSCCGSERIFVFTTNHIEKLDPALLRSGRMDMHVYMSYCTFASVKILLKNYLGYEEGDLSDDVLKELERVVDKAEITPADVSECLIKNKRDKERAVSELLEDMKRRAERNEKHGKLRGQIGRLAVADDAEEQEKRALDSSYGEEEEIEDSICKSSED
ncbi:AAA-ATPase At4g25835-like [Brassica rapa]|uniref:AAA-ATPase At4g25835-like n=1 Tax=Brassica campestris TaxID=3711 RepID=UPI00142DA42E|nr:AAA-ATPase At4g25835-like [Brassica rapa]